MGDAINNTDIHGVDTCSKGVVSMLPIINKGPVYIVQNPPFFQCA